MMCVSFVSVSKWYLLEAAYTDVDVEVVGVVEVVGWIVDRWLAALH